MLWKKPANRPNLNLEIAPGGVLGYRHTSRTGSLLPEDDDQAYGKDHLLLEAQVQHLP